MIWEFGIFDGGGGQMFAPTARSSTEHPAINYATPNSLDINNKSIIQYRQNFSDLI
jgi:hypothetical protein